MKIQISTDYAIRILHFLHTHNGMHTAMEIANATEITYPFFIKIANLLKKQGFLNSIQGRNGGYVLGKRAHEISFYDVYVCMEGEMQIGACVRKNEQCLRGKMYDCKLCKKWSALQEKIIEEMSSQHIAGLAS